VSAPFDVIVIGAGVNGLTAAGLLARRGRKVLVVERRDAVGGLASGFAFAPGYRSAGLLHDTTGVRPHVVDALGLGLSIRPARPSILALGDAGASLMIHGVEAEAVRAIAALSAKDAAAWPRFRGFIERIRPVLGRFVDEPPVDLIGIESMGSWDLLKRALRVRRLGADDMMELMRLPPMSVADWLGEWFETDLLKAALALPALTGAFMGPRSPGGNANLLLHECAAGTGVAGGAPALVAALERAARDAGATIRTGAAVEEILLSDGAARGVRLAGGERIASRGVAASCDPRTALLGLLPPGAIAWHTEHRLRHFRARGIVAQVLLALDKAPVFPGAGGVPVEFARTGAGLDDLERAFDAVKYRRCPAAPVLDIHVPTVSAPGLAPEGGAVVSALVHFAPYDPEGGWDDAAHAALADRVIAILERHAPGIASSVVGREVLSPRDIESRYGTTGGHLHHGESALDQILVRPAPECARYATPVPGLTLCGSGSHPGGGLTCAPGALAARSILSA